jgi:hypothetical protein
MEPCTGASNKGSAIRVESKPENSMSPEGYTTESPCHDQQASPHPPHLNKSETTIASSISERELHAHTDTTLQHSLDFPAVPQPRLQHTENTIRKGITNKNRVRWVRIMFWILWPIAIFFLTALMIKDSAVGSYSEVAALGGFIGTTFVAYVLVGIPCAILEMIICIFRKRKDPSVRLPIRNLVIPSVILILVVYGGLKAQKLIANTAQEKRNRIESGISHSTKKDTQHEQELKSLKEFYKSGIDDKQKQLDAVNSGLEIEPEPLKERLNKLGEIADSSTGYRGLVMKSWVEGMKELSAIGQEYQKAASEYKEPSKHDLQHLHESRLSLMRCKRLVQKQNNILTCYREFLERAIPKKPETIPFKDFDQNAYTAARSGFINGTCRTITPTVLAYYKTEEEIWDFKIAQVDLLIEKFTDWELSPNGATIFDNESDLEVLNELQEKLKQAADRSTDLAEKMLKEKRERLNN